MGFASLLRSCSGQKDKIKIVNLNAVIIAVS